MMQSSCVNLSLSPLLVSRAPLLIPPPPPHNGLSISGKRKEFLAGFLEKKRLQYLLRRHSLKKFHESFKTREKEEKQEEEEESYEEITTSETSTRKVSIEPSAVQVMDLKESEPDKIAEHVIHKAKSNIKIKRKRRKKILSSSDRDMTTCRPSNDKVITQHSMKQGIKTTANDGYLNRLKKTELSTLYKTYGKPSKTKPTVITTTSTQEIIDINNHKKRKEILPATSPSSPQHTEIGTFTSPQSHFPITTSTIIGTTTCNEAVDPPLQGNDTTVQQPLQHSIYHGAFYEQVRKEWRDTLKQQKGPPSTPSAVSPSLHKVKRMLTFERKEINNSQTSSRDQCNESQKSSREIANNERLDQKSVEESKKDHQKSISDHSYNKTVQISCDGNEGPKTYHKPTLQYLSLTSHHPLKTTVKNKEIITISNKGIIQNDFEEQRKKEKRKTLQEQSLLKARQRSEIYALNVLMKELEEQKFKEALKTAEGNKV